MTDNHKNLSDEFAPSANMVPIVVERTGNGERSYDLMSRLMKERIIFIAGPVTDTMALIATAQLLYLASENTKPIDMYIMSPGGSVHAGNAILDTMNHVKDKGITIRTTAMGLAMSMGSAILVNGTPGERRCMPSTNIMLHEPSGGAQGKTADMTNRVAEAQHMKKSMAALYKATTKMTEEEVAGVMNGPDAYMYGEEAKRLGIVDDVAYPKAEHMMAIATMQRQVNILHEREKNERKAQEVNLFPKP